MAESNVIAPIFRGANGGISDDIFTGIENSYVSSKNIEIRENARGISLSKKLKQDTTTSSSVRAIIKAGDGLFVAFGDYGLIKKCYNGTWSDISGASGDIISACLFNGYVYWATSTKLYKAQITSSTSSVSPTEVTTLQTANYHPLLVSMGDMYIGSGPRVDKVNISNVFEQLWEVETGSKVMKLDDLGGVIRITTQSLLGNSNVYLWDGVADEPNQTIPLAGYNIYQSKIYNGYPYVITNKGLGIVDGYKIYQLKKCEDFSQINNGIAIYNERLVIAGTKGLYSWGAKNKNYNEVLSYDYESTGTITCIYSDGVDLFVAWQKTNAPLMTISYGIDKLSSTEYNTQGELITRGYYANSLLEIKDGILARIGYSELATGQSIEIQYAINGGSFTTLRTIGTTTDTIASFTEDLFIREQFQYIQFKFILNGNGTNTPSVYALDFVFNNNVKR